MIHHIKFTLEIIEEKENITESFVDLSHIYEIIVGVLKKDDYEVKEIYSSMFKETPKIFIKKATGQKENL